MFDLIWFKLLIVIVNHSPAWLPLLIIPCIYREDKGVHCAVQLVLWSVNINICLGETYFLHSKATIYFTLKFWLRMLFNYLASRARSKSVVPRNSWWYPDSLTMYVYITEQVGNSTTELGSYWATQHNRNLFNQNFMTIISGGVANRAGEH